MIGVGLIGFGYWGPNLARNFSTQPDCQLRAICEQKEDRAKYAARLFPSTFVTPDYDRLLQDPDIQAILVATPVASHHAIAKAALLAGKDVFVEKPFTQTAAQAEELNALARANGRLIAVDHTFLFTGSVQKIKELVDKQELGDLLYFDSVRINLGLFQQDVNVIYDLAPHDLSILVHLIDKKPLALRAMGVCHGPQNLESLAYVHLEYEGGFVAHFHFSWVAPVKMRKTIIAGSKKMIVYDDLELLEKVRLYDKGIVLSPTKENLYKINVEYRTGDMLAPKLVHREALNAEAEHFIDCVRGRKKPLSDGELGLQVVRLLEASDKSLRSGGDRISLENL
jgi:predicted dehydrogenase